jgi:hypothetical protein
MSIIKFEYGFRSVNGIVKKVYALSQIPNIEKICDVWNILPIVYVRQFTESQDKNGVEIYNGDKLINGNKFIKYVVEFHDCGFMARQIDTRSFIGLTHWKKTLEVIGNIHE